MKIKSENLIFGRNPVKEALSSNRVVSIYLSSSMTDKGIMDMLAEHHLSPIIVSNADLDDACHGVHQGVAADVRRFEYLSINDLFKRTTGLDKPIVLILDGINDPQNFGAILRSCDVFNVSGVIIAKHNQVPLNATVAKTSAGAINYVPVVLVSNLNNAIRELKDHGFWIVSTDGKADKDYCELDYDFPTALVIGSEGKGISQLVLKNSDFIVKIPLLGHVNSLNASVAAGILLGRIRNK